MTRVIHIDDLSHPPDKSLLFACEYLSLILLVTMLHPNIHNKDTHYSLSKYPLFIIKTPAIHYQDAHYSLSKHLLLTIPDPCPTYTILIKSKAHRQI